MKPTKFLKNMLIVCFAIFTAITITACGKQATGKVIKPVIIYSNADDEAIEVMKKTLDGTEMK